MLSGKIRLLRPKPHFRGNNAPIFILGIERRSGTNFLQKLLELHPSCAAFPLEEDWFLGTSWMLSQYTDHLCQRYQTRRPLGREVRSSLLAALGNGIQELILEQPLPRGTKRFVLKTPSVGALVDFPVLFPGGKLLILIRDGMALTESYRRSFGGKLDQIATSWAKGASKILEFKKDHREGASFLIVRYEDLVEDLEAEMKRILKYLDLDIRRYDFKAASKLPVYGSSHFRGSRDPWKYPKAKDESFRPKERANGWSGKERSAFQRIAGKLAARLGYR